MSMVIRLKVPTEMHYAVIKMGTSEVNSSPIVLIQDLLAKPSFSHTGSHSS